MYVYLCSPYLQHGLCTLAHLMGASIRKDITSSVTHIVAYSVSGSKYKVLYPHNVYMVSVPLKSCMYMFLVLASNHLKPRVFVLVYVSLLLI